MTQIAYFIPRKSMTLNNDGIAGIVRFAGQIPLNYVICFVCYIFVVYVLKNNEKCKINESIQLVNID